jgi:hypothetical protein
MNLGPFQGVVLPEINTAASPRPGWGANGDTPAGAPPHPPCGYLLPAGEKEPVCAAAQWAGLGGADP